MVPILSTLQIVNLSKIIAIISTTRVTILTIAIITTTMAVSHEKKSIMFVAKKVVVLLNIQIMSNIRQKNFKDKTENFVEITANTMHFRLIIKEI